MKRLIWIMALMLLLSSSSAWALNAKTKKAIAEKEAYFKDPKNDVLFVIAAVSTRGGAEVLEEDIDVVLTMSDSSGTDTFKARTPCVMRFPMGEIIPVMLEEYNKTSGMNKEKFLMEATLKAPTITIMAQSQTSYAGVGGHVYFNGKEVSHDSSAIEYGAVSLSYTLPLREILEAQK
jgi:hypothetical protein